MAEVLSHTCGPALLWRKRRCLLMLALSDDVTPPGGAFAMLRVEGGHACVASHPG